MQPKDWHFPMPCPKCGAVAGNPFRVSINGPMLCVDVRCEACAHDWDITAPAPAPILTPKSDRRGKARTS